MLRFVQTFYGKRIPHVQNILKKTGDVEKISSASKNKNCKPDFQKSVKNLQQTGKDSCPFPLRTSPSAHPKPWEIVVLVAFSEGQATDCVAIDSPAIARRLLIGAVAPEIGEVEGS